MRRTFLTLFSLSLLLNACVPTAISLTPTSTVGPSLSAPTEAGTPATAAPTETTAPTESAPTKIIDVTKPPSEWDLSSLPEADQTAIKNWLADPYGATEQEKQTADDFLTKQWQLTLETDVTGKALYEKIVAYAQSHGGEVGLIPNSLHLQVRTDKDNLVVYGSVPGMDKYVHTSWYGFGANISSPDFHSIDRNVVKIGQINYYGDIIQREGSVYPITSTAAVAGDIVGVFDLVGVPKNEAQGAIIKMLDQNGKARYFEVQIQYSETITSSSDDMCTKISGNQIIGGNCDDGLLLPITTISSYKSFADHHQITHDSLLQIITDSQEKLHVIVYPSGDINGVKIVGIWQNGLTASQSIILYSEVQLP